MKRVKAPSLPRSFGYAFRGVYDALTRERNLRIHFAAGAFVLYFSRYYELSRAELAVLLLAVGFVIAAELLNTAVENAVDLVTEQVHPLAKTAKDVAAGAVLISAVTSVAVGILLLGDVPTIRRIGFDIVGRPLVSILVLVIAGVWVWLPRRK